MQTYTNKIILQNWKYIYIFIYINIYKIQPTDKNSLPQEQDNKLACCLNFRPF